MNEEFMSLFYDSYLDELEELEKNLKHIYDAMPSDATNVRLTFSAHDLRLLLMAFCFLPENKVGGPVNDELKNYRELSYIIHRANENEVGYARVSVDLLESIADIVSDYLEEKDENN